MVSRKAVLEGSLTPPPRPVAGEDTAVRVMDRYVPAVPSLQAVGLQGAVCRGLVWAHLDHPLTWRSLNFVRVSLRD